MPNIERAKRREKKRQKAQQMTVDGKGLLDPVDWEARLAKQQKKKRKRV